MRTQFGTAAALSTETVDRRSVVLAGVNLAIAELVVGRSRSQAAELLRDALVFLRDAGDLWSCGEVVEAVSALLAADGCNREAARLAGAADALSVYGRRPYLVSPVLWRELLTPARAALGEAEWDGLAAIGRSLTPRQAIEAAIAATASRRAGDSTLGVETRLSI